MEAIRVKDTDDLPEVADLLLQMLRPGGVVAFYGEMGAGKTTLIRAICERLGVQDNVNSPTFSIVNEYRTEAGEPIFHFDFYRIDRPEEALDFGSEEYLSSGYRCLIEWPEKVESLLADDIDRVYIRVSADGAREITVNP
ncbi:MAG: tRNA (adenosine(37)-N6)-threonylcarbamoyltransferase complex ATPase subunit type 1 TsaE [Rikenellaceae bacterium]|jgi:tRNA threonylcarbamoyladenosine biosynthesis protein TsaE|nr:tRNA (adenosine(37)-N6)-threonylcarbamoyltransferase complex ATPase subunit type 1 TsaE [Rikenellaceae bacterium]